MISTARRTSATIAGLATVGVSSLFVGAMPAAAAPTDACGAAGTLVSPGICEATFTSGTGTFARTPEMTKLEVLLVGAGGAGADQQATNAGTNGYAAAGGGGEVTIVDFGPAAASTLTFTVAAPADAVAATPAVVGTVSNGTTTGTVANGGDAAFGTETGGASGSGNFGANGSSTSTTPYGAGGGDGGSPPNHANGGAGTVVSAIAPAGSLFTGVSTCYGAGGAVGTIVTGSTVQGVPGCGAGGPADSTVLTLTRPTANRGGGGGGLATPQSAADRAGAAGIVIIRWSATATVSFAANGHGTAPAAQTIPAGGTAVRPADPTAAGYQFAGWFTNPQLTVAADFSAPVPASTTYYAAWSPLLAATGVEVGPAVVPASLAALMLGAVLLVLNRRRRAS